MQYAVARLNVIHERRHMSSHGRSTQKYSYDMRVCEWPRDEWEQAELLDGPFDTLLEAQDAMRRRVIPNLQPFPVSGEDWWEMGLSA